MFAGTYLTSGSSRILKSLNVGSILLPDTAPNPGDKHFSIGKSEKGYAMQNFFSQNYRNLVRFSVLKELDFDKLVKGKSGQQYDFTLLTSSNRP